MIGNVYHYQPMESFHTSNVQNNNVFAVEEMDTNNESNEVFIITEAEPGGIETNNTFVHKPIAFTVIARKKINIQNISRAAVPTQQIKSWFHLNWRCFLCTHQTVNYQKFSQHLNNAHSISKTEDVRYQCAECGTIKQSYASFLNHVRFKHHPKLKISCDVCDSNFKLPKDLSTHRESTHVGKNIIRPDVFYCTSCERAYATKKELVQHCENHIYICETCHCEIPEKEEFEKHKFSHYLEQISCVVCDKIFKASVDLEEHLQEHLNPYQFKCRYCEKIFTTCSLRGLHEQIHDGDNHFKCEQCEAKFKDRYRLMRHLHIHSEYKPYKCEICRRSFKHKTYLKDHQRTHEKQSVNICNQDPTCLQIESVDSS